MKTTARTKPYPAEKARQGSIVLRKRWQQPVRQRLRDGRLLRAGSYDLMPVRRQSLDREHGNVDGLACHRSGPK